MEGASHYVWGYAIILQHPARFSQKQHAKGIQNRDGPDPDA